MSPYSFAAEFAALAPRQRNVIASSDGARLAVQHWGNLDGPVILLVHAFAMSHAMWAPQIVSDLAERFHLVTFDHRGHGESEKPTDAADYQNGRLFADDIAAVIAATGAHKVHVVAWSMSGALFGDHLQHHGDARIASVTLIGAVNALGNTMFALGQIGDTFADPKANLIYSPHFTDQIAGWGHVNRNLTTAPMDALSWAAVTTASMQFPIVGRTSILARDNDYLDAYRALQIPISIIHAEDDRIVTLSAARRLVEARPGIELTVVPTGAHAPHWENAAAANAIISRTANIGT